MARILLLYLVFRSSERLEIGPRIPNAEKRFDSSESRSSMEDDHAFHV